MDGFLIVGNSIASAQAAWDLAEAGLSVTVVSREPWFVPPERDLELRAWLLQVSRHPNVRFLAPADVAGLERRDDGYRATVGVHSRMVDVERCTNCGECEKVCPVTVPGETHRAIWRPDDSVPDVFAIERLGRPPCSNTCPGGIHVQGFVALIAQRRFDEALALIREAIPFAAVCGRVCDHPCEANCRRNDVDEPVSVRALKRFVCDHETNGGHQPSLLPRKQRAEDRGHGRKVAVVGSGPAGLTVAAELAILGYSVTVFEALPVAGGMLAVGIPKYRLPKDVLRAEIAAIEELGVEIRLNTPVHLSGSDGVTLDSLAADGYEAIFIGVGAHRSQALGIPGEDAEGVVHGAQLLRMLNLSQQVDDPQWAEQLSQVLARGMDTRAVVVGGGNTAMDVSRSLRRLGLQHVSILYRRSREEMPASPEEIEDAEREGIDIQFQVAPPRVVDRDGHVVGVECIRTELGEPDASGRRRPVPVPGSEFFMDADLVVPATGQSPDLSFLGSGHGFEITRRGTFEVDERSYATSRPGVFAAGDAITQPASVIHAIGSAKRAAAAIDAYLQDIPADLLPLDEPRIPVAHRELLDADHAARPRQPVPALSVETRVSSFDEVKLGFDEESAVEEASRCLTCGPCSECMACVSVCEPHAISHDWREDVLDLDVANVLVADPSALPEGCASEFPHLDPLDREGASSQAALLMAQALGWPRRPVEPARRAFTAEAPRIGVWVCKCEGQIAERLSIEDVVEQTRRLSGVVWAETIDQACAPEAASRLADAIREHDLSQAVVAACSCCALDQVCYSCTTQRLRCKANLMSLADAGAHVEFVNVREQAAWIHNDADEATRAAVGLIAAGVARASAAVSVPAVAYAPMPSVVVVGDSLAAADAARLLASVGLAVSWAVPAGSTPEASVPGVTTLAGFELDGVSGTFGDVRVTLRRGAAVRSATAGAVVLVGEARSDGAVASDVSGVYHISAETTTATLQAMAARLASLLGRRVLVTGPNVAAVEEAHCRGCGTCVEACPFDAVNLTQAGTRQVASVTAGRCQGCGLCAALCPSGAMTLGAASDAEIAASLVAACQGWAR